MKSSKQIVIDAIIKEIEQGKTRAQTLGKIGKKWGISRTTFDRHWKTANEQHTIKQQAIKKEIAEVDKQAAIDARKKAIMTADERKEYLTKLIKGEEKVTLRKPFWNPDERKMQFLPIENSATISDRLSAIAELNKMEGDYSPTKVANTDKDGNNLPQTFKIEIVPPIE